MPACSVRRKNAVEGKLRNMTAIYLFRGDKVLLLYRQGGRVVNDVWTGSAGGHFEKEELNDARACVLRELQEEGGYTGTGGILTMRRYRPCPGESRSQPLFRVAA